MVTKDFIKFGGGGLVTKYKNSPYLLLLTAYPEYDWLPWLFTVTPKYFWPVLKNQRKFLDWAGKQLGVKDFSDWYKFSQEVKIMG
jgi:hypothetical protein